MKNEKSNSVFINARQNYFAKLLLKALCYLNKKIFFVKDSDRKNVIVFSLHKLGDTVLTFPSIKVLYDLFKENLVILCSPESESIYKLKFKDIKYVSVSISDFRKQRFAGSKIRRTIKQLEPKIVFDITGTIQSLSLLAAQKTEAIYGYNEDCFVNFYTKAAIKRTIPHLIDIYLDAVCNYIDKSGVIVENEFKADNTESGIVLIHPYAGWRAKEWNFNKYIKLTNELNRQYFCLFVVPLNSLSDGFKAELKKQGIRIVETGDLQDLITTIKTCQVLISNDSGPVHIANALGKSTFSIYGPTNPDYSLPFGKHHSFIQKRLKCSPEENKQYCFTDAGRNGCPSFECMNQLTFEEVYDAVQKFLEEQGINKKQS